jgi:hypothetical protein
MTQGSQRGDEPPRVVRVPLVAVDVVGRLTVVSFVILLVDDHPVVFDGELAVAAGLVGWQDILDGLQVRPGGWRRARRGLRLRLCVGLGLRPPVAEGEKARVQFANRQHG